MNDSTHDTIGTNAIPSNYSLRFTPNFSSFKFRGAEIITLQVKKKTNRIKLNASELKIFGAYIKVGDKKIGIKSKKIDSEKEELELIFEERVNGNVKLFIDFEGEHNDKLYGFYRSKYTKDGKDEYTLSSQFEAANARSAFPCIDEPAFKATFDVSFVISKNFDGISNTEVKSEKKIPNSLKEVTFHTTPRMSTYLLYLGVGKFDYLESKLGKLKIRIVTVPGKRELAHLALDYSKRFISFYEKYFRVKYPLTKIDFIAVPDFAAGAMENWGAIAFREVELLGDEKKTPVAMKQRIAEVIAHELAHQWFGDLVTMEWWNDIWLNESFATFIACKAVDSVFPKWEYMKQYFDDTIATALSVDQYRSTHPISVRVNSPKEIDEIFDEISYDKGGSVLYMIEDYVGREVFRDGLTLYLKKHSYSNATKSDLWNAIDAAAKKKKKKLDTVDVATSWINKPGYPIVSVTKAKGSVLLNQQRFFVLDEKKNTDSWPIPLHYATFPNRREGFMLFNKKSAEIKTGASEMIKVNYSQSGLYRTVYDTEMLRSLGRAILKGDIKGADSWGIENDLFAYARSGRIGTHEYLNFVEDFCYDSDYPLNFGVSGHLGWLKGMSYGEKWHSDIEAINLEFHKRILSKVGWQRDESEPNITTMLRSMSITRLGMSGNKDAVARIESMFEQICRGEDGGIDPNLRGSIYAVSAWHGDNGTYAKLVELYRKAKMPDEKRRLLQSLANFRSERLINAALAFSISKDVRIQDSFAIPAVASGNPVARELVWQWTKKHWKFLRSRYDSGTHMLSRYVENQGGLKTKEHKEEVRSFFSRKENMRGDIRQSLAQTLERIDANIKFVEKNRGKGL